MIAWISIALAHPVGDRAATQTSSLVVHRDRVDVDYFVDVPTVLVQTARPTGPDALAAMATEIASGLLLVVDGQVVSMTERAPMGPPTEAQHTVGFALHLQAPLADGAREISLQTGNLQEAGNFFAGDVRLDPGLRVEGCSLLATDGRRILRDDTLRWRRGDENRALTVTLADPEPRWWTLLRRAPAEPVRVRTAFLASHPDWRDPAAETPGLFLAAVGAALGLGATAGRRVGWAGALAIAGLAIGWIPAGVGVVAILAVGLAAGSARVPRLWAVAIGVAAAGSAATCPSAGPALCVAAAFALAAASSPGSGIVAQRSALVLAIALVVARSGAIVEIRGAGASDPLERGASLLPGARPVRAEGSRAQPRWGVQRGAKPPRA